MNLINSSHDWIIAHPVTMMLSLFGVGALLSLFAQEIKRFLGYWPLRTVRAGTRNAMQIRLSLLESVHDNAYRLLNYLALWFTQSIISVVICIVIFQIGSELIYHSAISRSYAVSLSVGMIFVQIQFLNRLMKDLANYDSVTNELRKAIDEHNARLAKKSEKS